MSTRAERVVDCPKCDFATRIKATVFVEHAAPGHEEEFIKSEMDARARIAKQMLSNDCPNHPGK